jgi:hypothetical protein
MKEAIVKKFFKLLLGKSVRSSLLGLAGAAVIAAGGVMEERAKGPNAPPITLKTVGEAVSVAVLGRIMQDGKDGKDDE